MSAQEGNPATTATKQPSNFGEFSDAFDGCVARVAPDWDADTDFLKLHGYEASTSHRDIERMIMQSMMNPITGIPFSASEAVESGAKKAMQAYFSKHVFLLSPHDSIREKQIEILKKYREIANLEYDFLRVDKVLVNIICHERLTTCEFPFVANPMSKTCKVLFHLGRQLGSILGIIPQTAWALSPSIMQEKNGYLAQLLEQRYCKLPIGFWDDHEITEVSLKRERVRIIESGQTIEFGTFRGSQRKMWKPNPNPAKDDDDLEDVEMMFNEVQKNLKRKKELLQFLEMMQAKESPKEEPQLD